MLHLRPDHRLPYQARWWSNADWNVIKKVNLINSLHISKSILHSLNPPAGYSPLFYSAVCFGSASIGTSSTPDLVDLSRRLEDQRFDKLSVQVKYSCSRNSRSILRSFNFTCRYGNSSDESERDEDIVSHYVAELKHEVENWNKPRKDHKLHPYFFNIHFPLPLDKSGKRFARLGT